MDAVDIIIPSAYTKALTESKLIPVVQPTIDIKSINQDGVEILFGIVTKPEVKLGKYTNLKVEMPSSEVSKEEIANEIETLIKKYAEIVIKDGKVAKGDIAYIDFEGFKDDIAFEGGKGENYPLEIGSNTFIPGFEEQVIGLSKGEEKDIKVTFPEEYPSEDLKGKEVIFKIKVNDIKEKKIPELNEEFFNDLGMEGVTSKAELEKQLTENIKVSKEAENENIYIDMLLEAASKNVEVDIPEEMIDEEINRMIDRYAEQLKMQGIDINKYYELTNTSEQQLRDQMKNEASKHVLYRLMLEEIAKKEKIVISDEEAQKEASNLAKRYQMEETEFLKIFGGLDMIKYDLEMRKTIEILKENK
jgi:trigger factor